MSTKKWGETFLKTGLPLEHLALTTLTGMGWGCEPKYEYERPNRDGRLAWFELDLIAYAPPNTHGDLQLLIECKYHDEQRFWFFLPCTTVDHQAQYEALSAGGDLEADDEVLHYAPYVPLRNRRQHALISLAPRSVWGTNVSRSGAREENSIHEALEQVGHAFVPFCLDRLYSFCSYRPIAVVLAIVTTAKLFRLKPEIQDVGTIRAATGPEQIADEVPWTWCYYAPRGELLHFNHDQIERWRGQHVGLRFTGLDDQLAHLWSGPHWVMVVNIGALASALRVLHSKFLQLRKDFKGNVRLKRAVEDFSALRRKAARV
jgi:hypothetical protein